MRQARRLADAQRAPDIAQDALARAWRSRASCETPAEPWGWLARIVRNESIRAYRQRDAVAEPELLQPTVGDVLEDGVLDGLMLRSALDDLSPTSQQLLWLRYGYELTQREIAEMLNRPEGTVKVQLHRARKQLRVTLEDQ